jgi:hypothetical protein
MQVVKLLQEMPTDSWYNRSLIKVETELKAIRRRALPTI